MGDMSLQAMEIPKGITAEDVWAMFRETAQRQKETDRQLKEAVQRQKETDRQLREMSRETEKALKETQRIVGDLGNRFGDIAEQLLTPDLRRKFELFGFSFEKLNRNVQWGNKKLDFLMEFDALMEENIRAMIVEVKAKLTTAAIDEQIRRMEKLRRYADSRGDKRQFFCAMAALTASERVIDYTLTNGFYLIMPSGEDVKITEPVTGHGIW